MASQAQRLLIKQAADSYARQAILAIQTKPIERIGERGAFSAPVNASGALARSVEVLPTPNGYQVVCNGYIFFLVYGRRPGKLPPVNKIDSWAKIKGIQSSAYRIAVTMKDKGSTIWRRYKGKNSGLLADIDIEEELSKIQEGLSVFESTLILDLFTQELE